MSLHQAGRLGEAAEAYRRIIKADANNAPALHYLGVIEASAGHWDEAKRLMARALAAQPDNVPFIENYATVLFQIGDYRDALRVSERGLSRARGNQTLLYVSAIALFKLGRSDESLTRFEELLAVEPNHLEALNERGSVLAEIKRYDEAIASFDRALALRPRYAPAHLNRGNVFGALHRYNDALAAYEAALDIEPRLAQAWLGRGKILAALKRFDEALVACQRALALDPALADAHECIGFVLADVNRHEDAIAAFLRAIERNPESASAWFGRGNAQRRLGRFDEAIAAFDRAIELDPKLNYVEGTRLYVKMQLCNWQQHDADCTRLISSVRSGVLTAPFQLLPIPSSSADRLLCAQTFAASNFPVPSKPAATRTARTDRGRIHIGYFSSDFRDHPVGYLIAGLFEQHDRSRFEISAASFGIPEHSVVRERMRAAAEHFVDINELDDRQICDLIRAREIDIAIDLNGATEGSRQGVFAERPAPVQAGYLGYACTMGTSAFDYLIADGTAVPRDQFPFYDEKIVWLPGSFMVNDDRRSIAEKTPTRTACGLPPDGFVFCCFNNTYKISPDVFRVWMRLLKAIDGSVLWLSQANATATANLRREAAVAGVAPERLIFASRLPDNADHLARQRNADLFLDTLPYNAHATAADALWAGLPVLTTTGETFAGRVATSLLNAVGMSELAVKSIDEYEALALKIARDRNLANSLKVKLTRNRKTHPLFDTKQFARNIETAYVRMWERYQAGLPPEHFSVEPN